MKKLSKEKIFLLALFCLLFSKPVHAGLPDVSQVMVTDVTPVSFSVIWASSEPSTSSLNLFEDEGGIAVLENVAMESQPTRSGNATIAGGAENNGVMKVRVSGLLPGTTYYFQTATMSKSGGEVATYPSSAPMLSVTTETGFLRTRAVGGAEVPFTNDLMVFDCYLQGGSTPAEGTLLVGKVEGSHYPMSGFVGDGVPSPQAYIDLNNLFGKQSKQNTALFGGEKLTLTQFMGIHGTETVVFFIPQNNDLGEMGYPVGPGLINAVRALQGMVNLGLEGLYDVSGDDKVGLREIIYLLQLVAGLR